MSSYELDRGGDQTLAKKGYYNSKREKRKFSESEENELVMAV